MDFLPSDSIRSPLIGAKLTDLDDIQGVLIQLDEYVLIARCAQCSTVQHRVVENDHAEVDAPSAIQGAALPLQRADTSFLIRARLERSAHDTQTHGRTDTQTH